MEYVVITYLAARKVRIDSQDAGFTNDTLMVEKGDHTFDLGAPQDYHPANVKMVVQNTTSVGPLIIKDFHPGGIV
jgi:hypothetical protein